MGFEIKKPEALELMARYDREETGYIAFDAFEEIMIQRYAAQDPMDEIRKAFELFDEDKRGKISFRNLKRIARDLGEKLTDEELRGMIDDAGRTGFGSENGRFTVAIFGYLMLTVMVNQLLYHTNNTIYTYNIIYIHIISYVMSTPDFAKPRFMKIRGYSSNSHNLILKWYPPN
ncbi:unnamed protein product [Cladocopium goreaui]|uniref:Centrin-1 (Caltractin) n=1 Tax=Cladocopium goreaui TaxID=2562237 RepID=A0A9P1BK97_9DINO|nr:unnamed protein product [Cladocopium goreaui]